MGSFLWGKEAFTWADHAKNTYNLCAINNPFARKNIQKVPCAGYQCQTKHWNHLFQLCCSTGNGDLNMIKTWRVQWISRLGVFGCALRFVIYWNVSMEFSGINLRVCIPRWWTGSILLHVSWTNLFENMKVSFLNYGSVFQRSWGFLPSQPHFLLLQS